MRAATCVVAGIAVVGGTVGASGDSVAKSSGTATSPPRAAATAARAGSGAARVNASRRALALRVADQMLDGVRMPVGSRPLTHASLDVALISVTADNLFLAASVTRTRLYRTAATPAVALAAIRGGISTRVPGATSVRAGSDTRGPDLIEGVTYPVIDAGRLGVRQLAVAAQTASAGAGAQGTVVRIQAEVQWVARRLPGQAIPRSARVVDITRPADPGLPGPSGRRRHAPAISLAVTRQA